MISSFVPIFSIAIIENGSTSLNISHEFNSQRTHDIALKFDRALRASRRVTVSSSHSYSYNNQKLFENSESLQTTLKKKTKRRVIHIAKREERIEKNSRGPRSRSARMHSRGPKNNRVILVLSVLVSPCWLACMAEWWNYFFTAYLAVSYIHTAAILLLSVGRLRHTLGIRASKAWRSEKCWKLDIQFVQGTAIPVEILLSSRVCSTLHPLLVARLDKSSDKTADNTESIVLPRPIPVARCARLNYFTSNHRSIVPDTGFPLGDV